MVPQGGGDGLEGRKSQWTKCTCGGRVYFIKHPDGVLSLKPPPDGIREEEDDDDADDFERWLRVASKHDSGEWNAQSNWTKYTRGRAYYENRETRAYSLKLCSTPWAPAAAPRPLSRPDHLIN